jgi:hypothetical protein
VDDIGEVYHRGGTRSRVRPEGRLALRTVQNRPRSGGRFSNISRASVTTP